MNNMRWKKWLASESSSKFEIILFPASRSAGMRKASNHSLPIVIIVVVHHKPHLCDLFKIEPSRQLYGLSSKIFDIAKPQKQAIPK